MKIAFTGTQHGMTSAQREKFIQLLKQGEGVWTEFHHGLCVGADAQAASLVHSFFMPRRGFVLYAHVGNTVSKQDWNAPYDELFPSMDNLERNRVMVSICEQLIATPRQAVNVRRSGTWSTIRFAWNSRKKVTIINPDGTLSG